MDVGYVYAAILVGAAFANISMLFFFHTKAFEDECGSKNEKIVSILIQDFRSSLAAWIEERNKIPEDEQLSTLIPSIERLSDNAKELAVWEDHVPRGKRGLHRISACLVVSGVLFAVALLVFGYEEGKSNNWILPAFLGVNALAYALSGIKEFVRLKSEIEDKNKEILHGIPRISRES